MKKTLRMMAMALMTAVAVNAQADGLWSDVAATAAEGTDYTVSSGAYTVSTGLGLAYVASLVNAGEAVSSVTLDKDIDLSGYTWVPMGTMTDAKNVNKPFEGTFDGAGHTISGMTVTLTDGADRIGNGLIGAAQNSTIKNVTMGSDCTMNIAGSTGTASQYIGMVVGAIVASTVENCHNSGTITSSSRATGGVVGSAQSTFAGSGDAVLNTYSVVNQCSNSGTITSTAPMSGGVVGYVGSNWSVSYVCNCFNTADITSSATAGGVVGYLQTPTKNKQTGDEVVISKIMNCYNTGNATATNAKGAFAGGIVGSVNAYSQVINCAVGNITVKSGAKNAGAVAGYRFSGSASSNIGLSSEVINSYYDENCSVSIGDASGEIITDGTAKSTADMTSAELAASMTEYAASMTAPVELLKWKASESCPVFDEQETGIASVAADESADGEEEIYRLDGTRVNKAVNGIYIVKRGNSVRKVMMR